MIYISMAFGNPYDEPWGPEIVEETLEWLKDIRVQHRFAGRYGGKCDSGNCAAKFLRRVKDTSRESSWACTCTAGPRMRRKSCLPRINAGCRRFDGALTGLGGCPFAGDDLVGNIRTEDILAAMQEGWR